MNLNFELILFYATIISAVIALFDRLFLAKKRKQRFAAAHPGKSMDDIKLPWLIDYAYAFFPVLLLVFLLRSFWYEPFRIPSGSLEPTLLIGDFILVNKYDYGVRLPVVHKKIFKVSEPKRGDIVIFRWPPNPSVDFIKRVIGVPGDTISYVNRVLYVNGQKIPQELQSRVISPDPEDRSVTRLQQKEDLMGVSHEIYQNPSKPSQDFKDIHVPAGMYFVMGDNRDDSADSRFWGFVPDENIVGKATRVWMSWNSTDHKVRWKRIGDKIG